MTLPSLYKVFLAFILTSIQVGTQEYIQDKTLEGSY